MKRFKVLFGILSILGMSVVISGCNDFELKSTPGFASDATSQEAAKIILQKCTGCHANGKSEKGFGYVDKPLLMMKNGYIKAGDHANSLIFKKVSSTPPYGDRMPKGGPYLTGSELSAMASWIDNLEDPSAAKYTVTISASAGITTNPTTSASVISNKTLAIEVTASGVEVNQSVGGTCETGTWSGTTYTTGKITADCSVTFVSADEVNITGSSVVAGAVTLTQSSATIAKNLTYTFTNVTARANDTLVKTLDGVTGTCPKGSWTGNDYTTGVITDSCTVIFSTTNPCPEVISTVLNFSSVQPIFSTSGANCTMCHVGTNANSSQNDKAGFDDGSGDFSLSEVLNKTAFQNDPMILVKPNFPNESLIYLKIQEDDAKRPGGRMPYGGSIGLADQAKVCNWILQGANP